MSALHDLESRDAHLLQRALLDPRTTEEQPRGLLASRAFWIGGALSLLLWTALVLWMR